MRMRLALSVGEPAGIGPDLAVIAAQCPRPFEIVAFANPDLLLSRAQMLGLSLALREYAPGGPAEPSAAGLLTVAPQPLPTSPEPGRPDPANAHAVLGALDAAWAACTSGECTALATGPLHKGAINEAGIAFTGHTEHLAALAHGAEPVMLLVAGRLRVALATTHLPLAKVPGAITAGRLGRTIETLAAGLARDFGIEHPRIAVLGLNPHAGEGGHFGREEMEIIAPVLDALRRSGLDLSGPVPADTAFVPAALVRADAVLAMYHDQGLPVLKHAGFGHAVNVTLGLPVVRTSVDHGTALELAGSGRIDPGSFEAALALAAEIAARRGRSA